MIFAGLVLCLMSGGLILLNALKKEYPFLIVLLLLVLAAIVPVLQTPLMFSEVLNLMDCV